MTPEKIEIQPYHYKYREQMITVWERSARATHHFVKPDDIDYYKTLVEQIDFNAFPVYCLVNDARVLGFIGVAEQSIETLFLDPDHIGVGLGTKLMHFALGELKANKVDVNEQNENAVRFYQKFGFETYDITEQDPQGGNYPILKMRINKKP